VLRGAFLNRQFDCPAFPSFKRVLEIYGHNAFVSHISFTSFGVPDVNGFQGTLSCTVGRRACWLWHQIVEYLFEEIRIEVRRCKPSDAYVFRRLPQLGREQAQIVRQYFKTPPALISRALPLLLQSHVAYFNGTRMSSSGCRNNNLTCNCRLRTQLLRQ